MDPSRAAALALSLLLVSSTLAHAQGVGINTSGAAADTSAILDLSTSAKGFLPPRMTAAQRAAIVLPATGLLVYQTDGPAGLYYNSGTPAAPSWQIVGGGSGSSQWTTNGSSIYYNGGNVGVGISAPSVPLGFGAVLGKKISLWSGTYGHYGFGIAPGRLQIHSEYSGTDVAIGYDWDGTFTERLAVKNNGALAVSGATGSAGQMLQSNGSAAAPTWVNPPCATYNNMYQLVSNGWVTLIAGAAPVTLPGMSQSVTVAGNAKAIVNYSVLVSNESCLLCGDATVYPGVAVDGTLQHYQIRLLHNGDYATQSGAFIVSLGPGTHTISLKASAVGREVRAGNSSMESGNSLSIQVVPQ